MPIEIDATSNLFLPSEGDGDREAFARIFRETWLRIPAPFREALVREWRKGTLMLTSPSPVINLVRGHRYAAENDLFGHVIHFNADLARLMQGSHLHDLIAHELAHVWHYQVRGSHVANRRSTWEQKECEADRLASHWGFDMTGLREWADAHGKQIAELTGTPHVSWKVDCSREWSFPPLWA
jgi:hypothetical protein